MKPRSIDAERARISLSTSKPTTRLLNNNEEMDEREQKEIQYKQIVEGLVMIHMLRVDYHNHSACSLDSEIIN